MPALVRKFLRSARTDGLIEAIYKSVRYPFKEDWQILERRIFALNTIEDRFTEIYKRRDYWGAGTTVSGHGSTLRYTENLRCRLPELFNKFSVKGIFDAPCGDFNWMREVLKQNDIYYTGGDIVLPLVESLRSKFEDSKTKFIHIDLTRQRFPDADLMICRDCLFHLSFSDAKCVLQNFVDSNIRYLLTTTHTPTGEFLNSDIATAAFRPIDLFTAPYNFPRDVLFRIPDWSPPDEQKEMCLWTKEQISSALRKA